MTIIQKNGHLVPRTRNQQINLIQI
jgi:hypothetical protein